MTTPRLKLNKGERLTLEAVGGGLIRYHYIRGLRRRRGFISDELLQDSPDLFLAECRMSKRERKKSGVATG